MDLVKEIASKTGSHLVLSGAHGLQSVLSHIGIAERYYLRAKAERDEHLFTDVIYRTNHAFEGILREAYVILAEQRAAKLTTFQIEEYLLKEKVLRGRVVELLKNYRQNWRNPSTHDHDLFFTEQEAFLAIVSVSAFVSILIDQMVEKIAYRQKYAELENAAKLARQQVENFDRLTSIEKVSKILLSYASHYLNNFTSMSAHGGRAAIAQMAAFIKKVAPELNVELDSQVESDGRRTQFDLVVGDGGTLVAVEARAPRDREDVLFDDEAALKQLIHLLYAAGLKDGVVFFYPTQRDHIPVATTASTGWPKDLNLREIFSDDPERYSDDREEPVSLVQEDAT